MTGRAAALTALERCRREGAWANAVLDAMAQDGRLDQRETGLAYQLCLGVLQNQTYLDCYIDRFSTGKLQPKLRDILRLGAYQILFMDKIPDRAAVSESVLLSRQTGFHRASGLVNAVLRRISENKQELPALPKEGTTDYLSIRYSHPQWLVRRLVDRYGYEFTEAFLAANNTVCPTDLQINTLRCSRESYVRALERAEIEYAVPPFPDDCVSVFGGRIRELPGFEEGLFFVQDRAAAMAVQIASPLPGMEVLDACAAPGGKSLAAAIRMKGEGSVLSRDIHENKLSRLRSSAERLGLRCIRTGAADARADDPQCRKRFDLVIADLPCSGLGVIRKRPEIRYKKEEEIAFLPGLQREILDNLSAFVKPGGTLLYSTCTVLPEENDELVKAFLHDHSEFSPVDFTVDGRASAGGCYTFWPQIDGSDGFFAAKMKRTES